MRGLPVLTPPSARSLVNAWARTEPSSRCGSPDEYYEDLTFYVQRRMAEWANRRLLHVVDRNGTNPTWLSGRESAATIMRSVAKTLRLFERRRRQA